MYYLRNESLEWQDLCKRKRKNLGTSKTVALFEEMLDFLGLHKWVCSVAKVDDVVLLASTETLDHLLHFLCDHLVRSIHDARV